MLVSAIEAQPARRPSSGCGLWNRLRRTSPQSAPTRSQIVGVDINPTPQAADVNLGGFTGSVHLLQGDLNDIENVGIPDGPYHAIFPALTFRDLEDDAKAKVIATLTGQLADEGFLCRPI